MVLHKGVINVAVAPIQYLAKKLPEYFQNTDCYDRAKFLAVSEKSFLPLQPVPVFYRAHLHIRIDRGRIRLPRERETITAPPLCAGP